MKGGKKGRDKGSGGRPGGPGGGRKPKPAATKRAEHGPPKKGSRKKPGYGGMSSAGED